MDIILINLVLDMFHFEILASLNFNKNKMLYPGLENNPTLKCCSGNLPTKKYMFEEGVSGHCLLWASGMLPPKLMHILGMFGFSQFFFVEQNPTPVKSFFENTLGNPFFDFLKYWRKLFKKKFWIEIWAFSNFFVKEFWSIFKKKNSKMIFSLYFKKVIWQT